VKREQSVLTPKVIEWLENRGLDPETADQYGWRASVAHVSGDVLEIPYVVGEDHVASKFRKLPKEFWQSANPQVVFWNYNALADRTLADQQLVITEGECLPPWTEVLTPGGWLPIGEYVGGPIAQWDNGALSWVTPTAFVAREHDGHLIRFVGGFVSMTVTAGHRMPGIDTKGKVCVLTAEQRSAGAYRHHLLPRSGVLNGEGIGLSADQIAFCIAISADATIDVRKGNDTGRGVKAAQPRYARIELKRARKVERMCKILQALGLPHKITHGKEGDDFSSGRTFFGIPLPDWVPGRFLPWEWIARATAEERDFIIDEIAQWDGNFVPNRNQTEYSTKHLVNAEWVQALCHTAGRCSTIIERKNQYGHWFKVSLLHGKSGGSYQNFKVEAVDYSGMVYCPTVPSTFFLAREGRRVFVTGNCDALSAIQSGFPRSVSVPNGAPQQELGDQETDRYAYVEHAKSALVGVKEIILAVDGDDAGRALMADLALRLGKARCKWVKYPLSRDKSRRLKDLNEVLLEYGTAGVRKTVEAAQWWAVEGVYSMDELPPLPDKPVFDIGIPGMEKHYKVRMGDFVVITGPPGQGKSTLVNDIVGNLIQRYGWRVAVASFEQPPQTDHRRALREWHARKPVNLQSPDEILKADAWINEHFRFIVPNEEVTASLRWVIEMIQLAVIRHDVRVVVIDPWNELDHSRPPDMRGDEYLNFAIRELKQVAKAMDIHLIVVAHPKKIMEVDGWPVCPGPYDISDGAAWNNKPEVVAAVWKAGPDKDETMFRVHKVRYHDVIGKPGDVWLRYNSYSRRFEAGTNPAEVAEATESASSRLRKR
jgi:twinkle protein